MDEFVVLPFTIIAFLALSYIVVYLQKKNADVVKSRIFLHYPEFKKAFFLFALFALILVFHVALIYYPHLCYFILKCSPSEAYELQHLLGLALVVVLIGFIGLIYKSIK
jgi:hypothetical protein